MPLESKLLFRYVNGTVTDFVVYTFPWGDTVVCVFVVCAFSAPAFWPPAQQMLPSETVSFLKLQR